MIKSACFLACLSLSLPGVAQPPGAARALPPAPPAIPNDVLGREHQYKIQQTLTNRKRIDAAAMRTAPAAALSSDAVAAVRRAAAANFPDVRGPELERTTFLMEVQTARILRANVLLARKSRTSLAPGARGILGQPGQTVANPVAQAEQARRKADAARKAAEAARKAADDEMRKKKEAEARAWEEKLNSLGDDAQLANIDLQNMLQQQQQTVQVMTSISKLLHDTAQSIIRKIGG